MRIPRLCRLRWPLALLLWIAAGVTMVASPALALPIAVDGINLSWGQLLTLLGLAVAWGDSRRMMMDLRDEMRRLPCQRNGCSEKKGGK